MDKAKLMEIARAIVAQDIDLAIDIIGWQDALADMVAQDLEIMNKDEVAELHEEYLHEEL